MAERVVAWQLRHSVGMIAYRSRGGSGVWAIARSERVSQECRVEE